MNLTHLIKKPVVTEKSLEATKLNRYTFEVDTSSTKSQIKQAVESAFDVDVIKVNTSTNKGVIKRTGRKKLPRKMPNSKKVIVEIKSGQSIKIFETQG